MSKSDQAIVPLIVIDVTRFSTGQSNGKPSALIDPNSKQSPTETLSWFGSRLRPAGIEVWFRISYAAIQEMREDTPQSRGARLVECLIAWLREDPERQLEDRNNFQVVFSDAGDTRIEPYGG